MGYLRKSIDSRLKPVKYIRYLDCSIDGGTGTFQLYRDNFRNVITSFARIILLIWAE